MKGLFQRLATRALGIAPVAEPIIAPIFARAPEIAPMRAFSELATRPERANSPAEPSRNATAEIAKEPAPTTTESVREIQILLDPSFPIQKSSRHTVEHVHEQHLSTSLLNLERRETAPLAQAANSFPSVTPRGSQASRPVASTARPNLLRAGQAEERSSEPVVRVYIGRIDVRAEFAAPAAPPPAKTRTPAMSLNDYAKLRAEGKR